MASTTPQLILEILHVISATVIVGWFAVLPMWKAAATKSGDPNVVAHFLRSEGTAEQRLVLPSIVILLVTGVLLTLGPWRMGFDLTRARPMQGLLVIAIILGILLVAGLAAPRKKMLELVEKGEGTGPAMDKLWGEWRTALLAGAVLSVLATGYMVYVGSL